MYQTPTILVRVRNALLYTEGWGSNLRPLIYSFYKMSSKLA